ncbi:MAG: DUF6044 family protein [Chloroflexota bacterium]
MRLRARLRDGPAPFGLYLLLALLSFPTMGAVVNGTAGWTYLLDVLDDGGGLPRLGIAVREWSAFGPTLWDPYLTAGNGFLGQFALPPYSPDVALAFLVGPFAGFAIAVWLTSALAGIGMHLFLRDSVGLATAAVIGGSIIALFCFWHPIYGISVAMLPLILWLGDRAVASGRGWPNRHALLWVVVATLGLYAGQVQVVIIVAALQLAWLVVVDGTIRRCFGMWAVTWVLALALYGPVLATQLALLPGSERSIWDIAYLIGASPGQAIAAVAGHYGSILVGIPFARGITPNEARYGTLFLGGIGLVLAIVGIVAGRRTRAPRALLVLLVAIPVLDFVAILATPLQEHLPILNSFQFVRIRHFFPFALAAAAAIGIDAISDRRLAQVTPRRLWVVVGGACLALTPVVVQMAIATRQVVLRLPRFDGADRRDVGWLLAAGGLAITVIGAAILLALLIRGRSRAVPLALVAVLVVLAGDRALLANAAPLLGPSISTFDESLALTPGQSFLLAQPGISGQRVLTFGDNVNRMAFQGLLQADGYQAIYPLTYHGFFGAMTAPGLVADPARYHYFHSWGARAYAFGPGVDPELVALVGARWLYVRDGETPTVPGLIERFRSGDVTIYEDPNAFPRAFVVGAVESLGDRTAVLERMAGATLAELRGRAFVSGHESTVEALIGGTPGPAGSARIVVNRPDRIEIDVRADRPGLVVLTDVMEPGWTADVDGSPAEIATVDATFRGVTVSPTNRRVVFRYAPGFTYLGFAVAAIALLVMLLIAGGIRVRRRRHTEPEGSL